MSERDLQQALTKLITDNVRVPTDQELRTLENKIAAELTPSVHACRDPNTGEIIVTVGMPKHGSGYQLRYGAAVQIERTGISDTSRYIPRFALVKKGHRASGGNGLKDGYPQRGDRVVITTHISPDGYVVVLHKGGEFRMPVADLDEDTP